MLPVPGSKVKSFEEQILEALRVLVLTYFRRVLVLQYFRLLYYVYCEYSEYFGGLYLPILP